MEIFISDDYNDIKTRFLTLLCSYLKIEERHIGKLTKISDSSKVALNLEKLPILVKEKDKIVEDEIEIAKYITKECGLLPLLFGANEEQIKSIENFIKHLKDLKYEEEVLLKELNHSLLLQTFINGYLSVTICDILSFAIVAFNLNHFSNEKKEEFCNVLRWADHIQNLKGIKEISKETKIWFTLPYKPFILETQTKKKDKKEKNKEQKEVPKEKPKEAPKEAPKEVHLMSKVDIRVGKIVNIFPNPEGDKLYNEEIDFGNGELRKIASGLRGRVDINDLKDSLVVCILNLKPRDLKGWTSHGMILCASKDDKVEPLRPPQGSQPGDLVTIGDLPREPASDKKTPWSKVCNDLKVNSNGQATYKNELIWKTDKGDIKAPTIVDGTIS